MNKYRNFFFIKEFYTFLIIIVVCSSLFISYMREGMYKNRVYIPPFFHVTKLHKNRMGMIMGRTVII